MWLNKVIGWWVLLYITCSLAEIRGFSKCWAPGKLTSYEDDLSAWFDHLKWSLGAEWHIVAGAYPGFCSMQWLGLFCLPLDGMLVHLRSLPRNLLGFPVNLPVPIYTSGWKEALWECSSPGFEPRSLALVHWHSVTGWLSWESYLSVSIAGLKTNLNWTIHFIGKVCFAVVIIVVFVCGGQLQVHTGEQWSYLFVSLSFFLAHRQCSWDDWKRPSYGMSRGMPQKSLRCNERLLGHWSKAAAHIPDYI